MRKDRNFVAFVTLCLSLVVALSGCNKDDNNNSNNNGFVTTANNTNSFDCLTLGINCHFSNNIGGFNPIFTNNGFSNYYQGGICACNQIGTELVAYVQNGVTRYSCVQSSGLNVGNGGFILSWSFTKGRRRNRRNRSRFNINVVNNGHNGINHTFYRRNSGLCQQSVAQVCFRNRDCNYYYNGRRHRNRYYCSNRGNRNRRGVCVRRRRF